MEFPYIYTDIVEELLRSLRNPCRPPITSQADLICIIIQECSGFLFNEKFRHDKRFRFLSIYEHEISNAAAEEVKCFEDLRSIITNLNEKLEGNEEVEGISRELLKLDEEMNLMEKVKHIQRELNVILKVLKDQIRVIEQMIELFTDGPLKYPQVGNVAELAEKRRKKLIKREEQIAALNLRAKHTFTDLETLIRRKEQQAQVLQTYLSSKQNAQALHTGKVVEIFTVVTIVFAPLSFLSAFFALGVIEYPRDDNGNIALPLSYVLSYILGIGGPVAALVIFFGVYFNRIPFGRLLGKGEAEKQSLIDLEKGEGIKKALYFKKNI